jgi:hypothetical protein
MKSRSRPSENLSARGCDGGFDCISGPVLAIHQLGLVDGAVYRTYGLVGRIVESHEARIFRNQLHSEPGMV